ncbi:MAG: hypothetical protein HYS24_04340 [Ignavibacteriales bacterium]|nr:hypothetical protein [Ignavibacteriales bacterium]
MRNSDQKKYIETLLRYEKKFNQDELKDFKMFVKRNKDDEDLDSISFKKLKDLYTKYYVNREKIDINDFFKKN